MTLILPKSITEQNEYKQNDINKLQDKIKLIKKSVFNFCVKNFAWS